MGVVTKDKVYEKTFHQNGKGIVFHLIKGQGNLDPCVTLT